MLNADWHHGDEDGCLDGLRRLRLQVLNADWHHGDEDLVARELLHRYPRVLNADWHHGDEDVWWFFTGDTPVECSTPIGITGTRT